MLKYLGSVLILLIAILAGSCREEFDYRASTGELRFSKDTIFLDTVFNSLSSSTYSFKVFNPSGEDIRIPQVYLESGSGSAFRLNVNGTAGKAFSDIEIPAKDSIYVFVESTVVLNDLPENTFLATDAIIFGDNATQQKVSLVTLIQDAVFLYPQRENGITASILLGVDPSGEEVRIEGFELADTLLTFTNEKPYVIYGYAAVPQGKTLEIQAGTRVYFHEASGMLVQNGGSLKVMGAVSTDPERLENEVIFEGDRLEPEFSDIPGQWGTLWLAPGSTGNTLEHLTVKNAIIGLITEGDPDNNEAKVSIKNSRFLNSSNINVLARNTSITATNTIFGSSGQASLYLSEGGSYEFIHCTLANFWNTGLRNIPALLINNYRINEDDTRLTFPLNKANFYNCIVTGNTPVELLFDRDQQSAFHVKFSHSLLQFDTDNESLLSNPLYDFSDENIYLNILLNNDPGFTGILPDPLQPATGSPVIDLGNPELLPQVPEDILGINRDALPDAGAYEYIPD